MPDKPLVSNFNGMENNDILTYDTREISTVYENLYSYLTEKYPKSSGQV